MNSKPKVLFVYDLEDETHWKDGLWAALVYYLTEQFDIRTLNVATGVLSATLPVVDFVLGWGGFGSRVDRIIRDWDFKKGLCIGGNAIAPYGLTDYNVLFYETEWYKPQIAEHPNIVHAFGINTTIFTEPLVVNRIFDYMTCGAFAQWKRQWLLGEKPGLKIAVGDIQKNNMEESGNIINTLLAKHVIISDQLPPEDLAKLYQATKTVYLPAEVIGGGERALLEARASGCMVEIEPDNPKLHELLSSPIWDHIYYGQQLEKGIRSCL